MEVSLRMASGKRILSLTITGLLVFLTGFSADMGSALAANEALILLDFGIAR